MKSNLVAAADLEAYLGEFHELRLGQFLANVLRMNYPDLVCPELFYIKDENLITDMRIFVEWLRKQ